LRCNHITNFSWISSSTAEKNPENWKRNDRQTDRQTDVQTEGKLIVPFGFAGRGLIISNTKVKMCYFPNFCTHQCTMIPNMFCGQIIDCRGNARPQEEFSLAEVTLLTVRQGLAISEIVIFKLSQCLTENRLSHSYSVPSKCFFTI
jgi:hypothetical protein